MTVADIIRMTTFGSQSHGYLPEDLDVPSPDGRLHAVVEQSDVPLRGIDHHNRVLLLRARVQGKTAGIVLILTRMGTASQVMDQVRALGAEVQAHFDEVGYVRVRLPLAQFARLRAIPDVIEARIDAGRLSYGDGR